MIGRCELCERDGLELTDHHLIPRTRHNKRVKRDCPERNETTPLCLPCHRQIHALLTEKDMEREFNTIEKLKAHQDVVKWITWIRKKELGKKVFL